MKIASKIKNFSLIYPELLKFWNDERNPEIFYPRSGEIVKWKCENNHYFIKSIDKIIEHYLKYNKLNCRECLSVSFLYPRIADEMCDKTKILLPYGSNQIVDFECQICHKKWKTHLYARTLQLNSCPHCNKSNGSSNWEYRIQSELELFFNVEHRKKIGNKEVDILIRNEKITIEVDSVKYHEGKDDSNKITTFVSLGFFHIRIMQKGLQSIHPYEVAFMKTIDFKTIVNILQILVDNKFLTRNQIDTYKNTGMFQNQSRYFELIQNKNIPKNPLSISLKDKGFSWDSQRNFPIEPQYVAHKSNESYWFKCNENANHVWEEKPYNITKNKGFCPFCIHRRIDPK